MSETNNTPSQRGNWGSRLAFILAASGSAIGLGNIWGFPIRTANNGGGAFVLIYLLCVLLVGLPVMLVEMTVGRAGQRNPVGAIRALDKGTKWHWVGGLGVFTGLFILSYYSVISGWTISYMFETAVGTFKEPIDTSDHFATMVRNPWKEMLYHSIFILLCIWSVIAGIQKGIERTIKIAMPALGIIIIILLLRALTLPGAGKGLEYYLKPDFSNFSGDIILQALGQAFFSLSLGMGAIITYGSYLKKHESLPSSAGWVVAMDSIIALLVGCIIFPALVFADLPLDKAGPGLIFEVLPQVFSQLPWAPWGGILFGTTFFLLLAIAAYTSAISLMEVPVSYLIDDKKWSRKKATWTIGFIAFALGVPSALSLGAVKFFTELPGLGSGVLDIMSGAMTNIALTGGALGLCLFLGWRWGLKQAMEEIRNGAPQFRFAKVWGILTRYVAPIAITAILLSEIISFF